MKTCIRLLLPTLALGALLTGGNTGVAGPVGLKLGMTSGGGALNNTNPAYLNPGDLAGAPGLAQTNWNNLGRYGDTVHPLDESGAPSGLTVSWDAGGIWSQQGGGTPTAQTAPDNKLMNSYDDSNGNVNTVSTSGSVVTGVGGYSSSADNKPWVYVQGLSAWLAAQGACSYDVVLYEDGDATSGRTGQYWVENATGAWTSMTLSNNLTPFIFIKDTANFLSTLTYVEVPSTSTDGATAAAGNFTVFPGLSADSILIRTEKYRPPGGTLRAPINAIQLIPHTAVAPVFPYPMPATPQTNYGGGTFRAFCPAAGCNLSYQWQAGAIGSGVYTNLADGGNVWGANTPTLTITNLALAQTADYVLSVNNGVGPAVVTPPTSLYVQPAVVGGASQPVQRLYPTGTAHFNGYAAGSGTLTFQWLKNGTPLTDIGNISGSTTTNLTVSNVGAGDAGTYTLAVTSAFGVQNSAPATLSLLTPPVRGSFAESVMTNHALAYWRFNETFGDTTAYDYAGGLNGAYLANSANQQPGPIPPDFQGFEAANTGLGVNPAGTAIDQSWVTIPALRLHTNTVTFVAWMNLTGPQQDWAGILTSRRNGTQAGFNFSNTKNELVYTWNNNTTYSYHSGLIVSNNTWSMVALVVTATNATFYCGDSNGLRSAFITLNNNIELFDGPASIGDDDTWGTGRAMYGFIDEMAVFNRSLSPTEMTWLFVAGRSAGAALPPTITQDPAAQDLYFGRPANFSVGVSGLPPITYQWRKNGVNLSDGGNISGALTANLTVGNAQVPDEANYDVIASNPGGSVTSAPAPLSLTAPTGAGYEAAVMASAPFAYWRLGETGNSVSAYDFFGGHTAQYGTYSQAAGEGAPGPVSPDFAGFENNNTGLAIFPAQDQSWVTVPPLNLNTNTLTFAAWINPVSDPQTNAVGLVFQRQGLTVAGLAYSSAAQTHLGYNWNNAAGAYNWDSGLVVSNGMWSFAALVVEPARATLYLYNTNTQQAAGHYLAHPVQPFAGLTYIGSDPLYANGIRNFSGAMDEVTIWNRALTGDQIAALFTAASGIQIPVSVVLQPAPLTLYAGMKGQLTVTAAGTGPYGFQWLKNGAPVSDAGSLSGSTTATLTLSNSAFADAGNYSVVITNAFSSVTSVVAQVTVLNTSAQVVWSAPATISVSALTNQPGVVVGAATFGGTARSVTVTNASGVWTYDFTADGSVATATGTGTGTGAYGTNTTGNANFDAVLNQFSTDGGPKTITINGLVPGHQYSVQLIALDDRDSSGGQHREQTRRAYFQDPYNATNVSATFYMSNNYYLKATFTAAFTNQILLQQLPGWPDGFTDIGNGALQALVVRDTTTLPSISQQPRSTTRYFGHPVVLSARIYGPPPVSYRWQRGTGGAFADLGVSGTLTQPFSALVSFNIPSAAFSDAADYRLIVSNTSGSVTSQVATVTVVTPASGTYEQAAFSYGPVAYWKLNEPAHSAFAYDLAGGFDGSYGLFATNGMPGVPNPPFPGFPAGEFALQTTASVTQSWVTVPALNLNTNTVTFTAWIKPTAGQSNWSGIFMTRSGTQAGIGYNDQGMLAYTWNNNSTWSFVSGLSIPADQWSFVAVAIDPNNAALYLFNQAGAQGTNNAIAHQAEAWSGIANIGNDPNDATANRTFNGLVDHVAVYNRTLSPNEITNLFHAVAMNPPASAPAGLTATAGAGQVVLDWGSVTGASSYNVKRATVSGGPYVNIASVPGQTYTDTAVVNGTRYYYVVTAANSAGESAPSNEASAQLVSTTPPQLGASFSGGQLHLSWPADHTGWTLLYQTNAAGAGLGTNWTPWPNSSSVNSVTVPVVITNGSAFFRLVYP